METLLTLKQVQDILQVDRTTIHRMLKDGRLMGVKVGGQWRFSSQVIETMTRTAVRDEDDENWGENALPLYCLQRMQDVFAEISGISAVVADLSGNPLTQMSNCCAFCALIQSDSGGKAACEESWRQMNLHSESAAAFLKCHAGLEYARAPIKVDGQLTALLISGQFHLDEAERKAFQLSLPQLAEKFNLSPDALRQAALGIPLLNEKFKAQLGAWLNKVAQTFSDVSNERSQLLGRLRQIAEITLDVEGGTLSKLKW